MKSLVPWMCLVVASAASQQLFADDDFNAYRIGNYSKAAEPLMSKAGKDPVADYYLGRMFLHGYGHLKNNSLAIRYFTKSAEKGYLPAVQLMAKYSLFQEKNPEQAIKWFKQAAAAGDVNAQMYMAAAYLFGVGVKPNADVASKYYIDAAKNGNSIAQFTLGEHFIDGRYSANNKLGLIWLNKAAASGNVRALTKLGSIYVNGKLVEKDVEKGTELLNKAAAQNYTPAMIELGEAALNANQYQQAVEWFNKAINLKDKNADLHLARAYMQEKSPIYSVNAGFLGTLKAAQNGSTEAKSDLAQIYKKGIGVKASEELAKQWADQAALDAKKKNTTPAMVQAALWLSDGETDQIEKTNVQMNGLFNAWQNPIVMRENAYNPAPKFEKISRQDLFKPQFELTQPNDIQINSYYDALISTNVEFQANQWTYPMYPLNEQIAAIERANSKVINQPNLPAPYADANYYDYDDYSDASLMDLWTEGWQQQANYMSVFNQLYFRALLGDAQSQFEIGQMFQYGIGVTQNDASAIIFYQNAAQQQHLGAEYNLGLLYLEHPKENGDYQVALNWLTDSAFKGNRKSQYVLARILSQGKKGPDGNEYIKANPEQAQSMLYLAAANNFGPAEYELAENLARTYDSGLGVELKKHKLALIRKLYEDAAGNGVLQAMLPLAFYNAMDQDKKRQDTAFSVAEEQALAGDEKAALLLGMLYDRGIGVTSDHDKAVYWYQHAGQNQVSQFIMGTYTTEGKGVVLDKQRGLALLTQSAEVHFSYADFNLAVLQKESGADFLPTLVTAYNLGNSNAGILLADYYLSAENDAEKMNKAKEIYSGLAEKGDQFAQLKLAYMLNNGLGSAPDLAAAQRWYTASATQGNVIAQFLLGQFYQLGENGAPDYSLAKEWYKKAASQLPQASVALGFIDETVDDNYTAAFKNYEQASAKGDLMGTYNLALMYFYGKGMPVDYSKAKALYTEVAEKDDPEAMTQLAAIYFKGLGQPRDVPKGLVWYKKAAALGDGNALYELGLLSETGVATKLDYAEAIKSYQAAADQDNERAMLALARMYHYGLGVKKDPVLSASFYQKLANRENAYAQYKLGTFYLEGTAGERSEGKGKQLLKQASDNGNLEARQILQKMDAKSQPSVSFIQPAVTKQAPVIVGQGPDLMYLDAVNEWDRGDEALSRVILQRLVTKYPEFAPAKKVYEQLNQAKVTRSYA